MRGTIYLLLLSGLVFTGLHAQSDISRSSRSLNQTAEKKNSHGVVEVSSNETNTLLATVELKDFPVFKNTGDKEKDNFNYKQEKQQWIDSHPQEYRSFINTIEFNKEIIYSMPGFPKYVDTGDAKADMAKYRSEKSEWFKNNHDILAAMKNSRMKENINRQQQNIKK